LALQLECHRDRRCGRGPCESGACDRMGQMCRSYGTHSPESRHERARPVDAGRRCLEPRSSGIDTSFRYGTLNVRGLPVETGVERRVAAHPGLRKAVTPL
jgi:hypothetical protein